MYPEMYEFFNRIEERHWWFQARALIIQKLLDSFLEKDYTRKILDLGCGTGMMLNTLKPFGKVYGLDNDEHAISYAKSKVGKDVIIWKGNFPESLPRGEQFNLVTVFDVIEHVENDIEFLCSIRSILARRGIVLLTVPAFPFLWSPHDVINDHKRRYTKKELIKKLNAAGFKILKCSYFNTLLFPPASLLKVWNRLRFGGSPKAHFETVPLQLLNIPLRFIFSLERFFLPYVNFPFGVSLLAIAIESEATDRHQNFNYSGENKKVFLCNSFRPSLIRGYKK